MENKQKFGYRKSKATKSLCGAILGAVLVTTVAPVGNVYATNSQPVANATTSTIDLGVAVDWLKDNPNKLNYSLTKTTEMTNPKVTYEDSTLVYLLDISDSRSGFVAETSELTNKTLDSLVKKTNGAFKVVKGTYGNADSNVNATSSEEEIINGVLKLFQDSGHNDKTKLFIFETDWEDQGKSELNDSFDESEGLTLNRVQSLKRFNRLLKENNIQGMFVIDQFRTRFVFDKMKELNLVDNMSNIKIIDSSRPREAMFTDYVNEKISHTIVNSYENKQYSLSLEGTIYEFSEDALNKFRAIKSNDNKPAFNIVNNQKVELNVENFDPEKANVDFNFTNFGIKLKDGMKAEGTTHNLIVNKDGNITNIPITKALNKAKTLTVDFVDKDNVNTKLKQTVNVDVSNKNVGEEYNIDEYKESEITDSNGLVWVFASGETTGRLQENNAVTLKYAKKQGKEIVVKFVDENGTELKTSETVNLNNLQVGANYDANNLKTESLKLQEKTYTFTKVKSGSLTGKVSTEKQEIVLEYSQQKGEKVIVNILDNNGATLKEPITLVESNMPLGTDYSYTPERTISKDGLVYELTEGENTTGKSTKEVTVINYRYAPKQGKEVVLKHIDSENNTIKADTLVKDNKAQVGESYNIDIEDSITMDEYTYKLVNVVGDKNGTVTDEKQIVTAKYKKQISGNVIVNIVDEKGNVLETKTLVEKGSPLNKEYMFTPEKEITVNGLKYIYSQDKDIKGNATEEDVTINAVYSPKVGESVIIKHTTIDGKELAKDTVVIEKGLQVGEKYTKDIETKDIVDSEGKVWEVDTPINHIEGDIKEESYVYVQKYKQKIGEDVTIVFVDENGDKLFPDKIIEKGQIGETWEFKDYKPTYEIKGETYRYSYSDSLLKGEFSDKKKVIKIVYKKDVKVTPKELPKTNSSSTATYSSTALIGLSLLLRRKLRTGN